MQTTDVERKGHREREAKRTRDTDRYTYRVPESQINEEKRKREIWKEADKERRERESKRQLKKEIRVKEDEERK